MEKDITKITTREVVKRANVNVSMLHYYYKTKNDLFLAAIKEAVHETFDKWLKDNINWDSPSIVDLEKYLSFIIEGIYKYPYVSKSIVFLNQYEEYIEDMSFNMPEDLTRIVGGILKSNSVSVVEQIHFLCQIIISLRVSTSLINSQLKLDFNKLDDRKIYIKKLLNSVFPQLYN